MESAPPCLVISGTFIVKLGYLCQLPSFQGMESKNSYLHLNYFNSFYQAIKERDTSINAMKLTFFPSTLKDKAKYWLNNLKSRSTNAWAKLQEQFLKKFFPQQRSISLRQKNSTFNVKEGESFPSCWTYLMKL